MALTKPFEAFERPGLLMSYKLAAVKIYKGALVGVNSSGYATPMTHATASLKFVGVANETVDNSAGSAGDKSVNVTKVGSFVFKAASGYTPAQSDVGSVVNVTTDFEVKTGTSELTNTYPVGTISSIEATSTSESGVRIRIDAHIV